MSNCLILIKNNDAVNQKFHQLFYLKRPTELAKIIWNLGLSFEPFFKFLILLESQYWDKGTSIHCFESELVYIQWSWLTLDRFLYFLFVLNNSDLLCFFFIFICLIVTVMKNKSKVLKKVLLDFMPSSFASSAPQIS